MRGRQRRGQSRSTAAGISIHAPMRGRLFSGLADRHGCDISIHAPMRGRLYSRGRLGHPQAISIHAPMRGRQRRGPGRSPGPNISIHAPMRGRPKWCSVGLWMPRFQSTPPCGGDSWNLSKMRTNGNFNPRPHAGATRAVPSLSMIWVISIHAPMRGRRQAGEKSTIELIFQSTPPCGGDLPTTGQITGLPISIHAPMRGRRVWQDGNGGLEHFNPRPHAGATIISTLDKPTLSNFNPRPHAGATKVLGMNPEAIKISIHAPMRGRR